MALKVQNVIKMALKLLFFAAKLQNSPRHPASVTKCLGTILVCDTISCISSFSTGAKSGSFCTKKIYFWFTPRSKRLVARLVAFTAVDRFFKRLWAADETS